MEWYKNLYLGEAAKKKKYRLYRKINKRRLPLNAYVVTLPSNEENVLDIYRYTELRQKHYAGRNIFVIGLAYGKDEAVELAANIISEVWRNTGTVKVGDYIRKREELGR